MDEFNRMTIVAAAEMISHHKSHSDMEMLEIQWDILDKVDFTNKTARAASWARIACDENLSVMTEDGLKSLAYAVIDTAINIPKHIRVFERSPNSVVSWNKLVSGLRFDGFEINEDTSSRRTQFTKRTTLERMLPNDIPGLNFREARNEVNNLLEDLNFVVAKGHLTQALSAYHRAEWSSANGELRNFFESYLNEIAVKLGCSDSVTSKEKRDYLGERVEPPFLIPDYNEWHSNNQKPQFVQGLMSRMHPHGGHPGLSEEEDATFRLQTALITARLFLRRFNNREQQ